MLPNVEIIKGDIGHTVVLCGFGEDYEQISTNTGNTIQDNMCLH